MKVGRSVSGGGSKSKLSSIKSSIRSMTSSLKEMDLNSELKSALSSVSSNVDQIDMGEIKTKLGEMRQYFNVDDAFNKAKLGENLSNFSLDTSGLGEVTGEIQSTDISDVVNNNDLGGFKIGLVGSSVTDHMKGSFGDINSKLSSFTLPTDGSEINKLIKDASGKLNEFKKIDVTEDFDKVYNSIPSNEEIKKMTDMSKVEKDMPDINEHLKALEDIDVDSLLGDLDI